ncbi:MAG TPA: GIY-YIG nuclease family protein [Candidatus Angelobacter sp.]|jgi:excinuclease UvrABC nuclease subunit
MNFEELIPLPQKGEAFKRHRCRFVPETSGCYVLTTFLGEVLYVGLALNLRRRMDQHLDSPGKKQETPKGAVAFFRWVETTELNKVERTWMNIHTQHEGTLPELNKVYSPVDV